MKSRRMRWPGPLTGARVRGHDLALGSLVGALALGALCLVLADAASAQFVTDPGTVIQTIFTSTWTPPSPDPSGITYRPDIGKLLTCDAEVEEIPPPNPGAYQGVNCWTHSSTGVVSSTTTTVAYTSEPTGVSFDPAGGRLWIPDDVRHAIFQVEFGSDGVFGTADDQIRDLDRIDLAGCHDPEDVTYDNLDGHLYVAGGFVAGVGGPEVCEIEPGANDVFDGPPPLGDDVVTTFSTTPFGITDPEGIVYDPFWNTLVIADRGTRDLYELTPEGNFLRKIDVNFPTGAKPASVTIAPGSTNPSLRNYWVTDRGVDNDSVPSENDGRIFEVVAIPLGGNGAPVVDAGSPQTIVWPANSVNLNGFVSDDGHPYPPSTVTALWSVQSGPGSVTFADPADPTTTATFAAPGEYALELRGDDSARQTVDTVPISVDVALSVTTSGPGSVSVDPPGGSYSVGQTVSLTAIPSNQSASFIGWRGSFNGTANPISILMNGNKSLTASFSQPKGCGVGPELAGLIPALAWLHRRRSEKRRRR